jgi:small-conductance mechanosensitive channel
VIPDCSREVPRAGTAHRLLIVALLGLLATVVAIPATPALAESVEPKPAGSASPLSPSATATISAADVAVEVERVTGILRELEARSEPDPAIVAIEEKLAAETQAMPGELAEARAALALLPSLSDLQNLEAKWKAKDERFAKWEDAVTHRAKTLEQQLTRVDELRDRWDDASAKLTDAPPTLLARIREAVEQITNARKPIEARRDAVLLLRNGLAQRQAEIDEILEETGRTREQMLSRLLARDAPPFWRMLAAEGPGPSLRERIRDSMARDFAAFSAVLKERSEVIPTWIVLFGASLIAAYWLRTRARGWREGGGDESARAATAIFERPISAAIVLWVFLTPLPYSSAAPLVREVAVVALIVALVRLVLPLLGPELRRSAYALVGIVLADQLRQLLASVPTLERVLFSAECVAGIGVLWMIERRDPWKQLASPTAHRILAVIVRLAIAALAGALVANALGYLRLARLLGEGTMRSAYAAVLADAFARVADGAVVLLLRVRPVRSLHMVQRRRAQVDHDVRRLVRLAILALWAVTALRLFNLYDAVAAAVTKVLTTELTIGELALSLGDIAAFAVTVWGSFLLARLIRTALEEDVFSRLPTRRGIPYAISTIASYTVLLLGFLAALSAAGAPFGRITLLLGGLGVGIGFGLQNVVNNFVSGVILLFERPIQIGDVVEIGTVTGSVKRIGLRSSTLETGEGAEVIVPNANLIAERLVNWTLTDSRRRITLPVGVAYGSDPERVLALLAEVANKHPDVLKEPAPKAFFLRFGENSLDFELLAWIGRIEGSTQVRSDLAVGVNRALNDAGITIPFPQRELHLKSVAPELPLAFAPPAPRDGSREPRQAPRPSRPGTIERPERT